MVPGCVIQQREYQRRESELEAATTEYGLAESQLHSCGWGHPEIDALVARAGRGIGDLSDLVEPTLRVTSPLGGRVITRDVVIGEHVHPDKLLFTVSDLGTLWGRIDELVAGTRAQVIVKVSGEDLSVLKRKAGEIATVLSGIEGVADLAEEKVAGQPYLTVTVDRARIARHGLNVADVLELIETAVGGKSISQVYLENRVADVAIRLPDDHRRSPEALRALLVQTPAGGRLPLGELAAVEVQEGPVQVSREDGERRIGIELNVAGRDIGSVVREAQAAIRQRVALPPGYYLTWGGQFENQQAAMRRLALIAPAVAALIFLLQLATFGGLRPALLVIFNLPFALAGGVFALWVSGLYLSVPASVGFIVLFGVAVLNGLVLISSIMQLRAEGRPTREAVVVGCDSRLRPVLMTAAIAIFSLLPMVVATGPGAEVQRPLAVVVIGGLITSTLLTLLVLPALYGWFEGERVPAVELRMER